MTTTSWRRYVSAAMVSVLGAAGLVLAGPAPVGAAPTPTGLWALPPNQQPQSPAYLYLEVDRAGSTASTVQAASDADFRVDDARYPHELDLLSMGDQDLRFSIQDPDWSAGPTVGYQDLDGNGRRAGAASDRDLAVPTARGLACDGTSGWTQVDRADRVAGQLVALQVRFELHCAGSTDVVRGQAAWSTAAADVPSPNPRSIEPTGQWRVGAGPGLHGTFLALVSDRDSYVGSGRAYLYHGDDIEVVDNSAGGPFHFRALVRTGGDFWSFDLRGPARLPLPATGFYGDVKRSTSSNPAFGGLDVSGDGGCNALHGWYRIDAVRVDAGAITDLKVRFEQRCDEAVGPPDRTTLHGELHWSAGPSRLLPAPTGVTAFNGVHRAAARWDPVPGATGYEVVPYFDGHPQDPIRVPAGTTNASIPVPDYTLTRFSVGAIDQYGVGELSDPSNQAYPSTLSLGPFATMADLVRAQYEDFAARTPTDHELATDVAALEGGYPTIAGYLAEMRNRPEWGGVRTPILRLYRAAFSRSPDHAGWAYWASQRKAGTSLASVAASFVASREFAPARALSNAAFARWLYTNVMGRAPDPGGVAYWQRRLDAGARRSGILLSFSETPERKVRFQPEADVSLLFDAMLRRMPTDDEIRVQTEVLAQGHTVEELASSLFHDPLYARLHLG